MSESCNGSCSSCPSAGNCSKIPPSTRQGVGRIIAVGSGKGGVGKSTVSADVTGDGKVDISDVNAIINVMLGK